MYGVWAVVIVVMFFVFLLEGGVGVGAKNQGVSTFFGRCFAHLFGLGDVMDYVIFWEVGLGGSNTLNGRSFEGLTHKIDLQSLQKEVSWVLVMRIVVMVSRIKNIEKHSFGNWITPANAVFCECCTTFFS